MTKNNFWKNKKLSEFTPQEWESICSGCGRCCQIKLEDEDSGEIYYTDVVCRYFDEQTCRCREYQNRCTLVPTCYKLNPENINLLKWMPRLCAYRILNETGNLPDWHPLLTGQPLAPRYSVKGRIINETLVDENELEDHIIEDGDDFCD